MEDKKITVKFRMLPGSEALAPAKAHCDDAAYDLRSRSDLVAKAKQVTLVPTGLQMELPAGYEAQIRPRSGLALKHALTLLNSPGTIDAGYRGEIACILFNAGETDYEVKRGDRIAQMVICALPSVDLQYSADLSESERSAGGFGSTGKS